MAKKVILYGLYVCIIVGLVVLIVLNFADKAEAPQPTAQKAGQAVAKSNPSNTSPSGSTHSTSQPAGGTSSSKSSSSSSSSSSGSASSTSGSASSTSGGSGGHAPSSPVATGTGNSQLSNSGPSSLSLLAVFVLASFTGMVGFHYYQRKTTSYSASPNR